jgi:Zn-finger nucleic acid-binding protein
MNCPNCNETLVMTDRQGVEIDYCPKCRGVWLDRGELDKIIERSATYNQQPDAPIPPPPPPAQDHTYNQQQKPYDKYQKPYGNQQYPHNDPYYRHKKKKGFLDDLFDF